MAFSWDLLFVNAVTLAIAGSDRRDDMTRVGIVPDDPRHLDLSNAAGGEMVALRIAPLLLTGQQ